MSVTVMFGLIIFGIVVGAVSQFFLWFVNWFQLCGF